MQLAEARYRRINLLAAWGTFLISFLVYALTVEPTASFWDCGEYIACANGLEIGHPPGAPLFLLIGRAAAILSFGHPERVALCINLMSALASAFTIFFLHLTITALARKLVLQPDAVQHERRSVWLVQAAGVIGALAYAFTDSFWFSAVEGEVYALSSLFTAVVVWAMLRWERIANEPHADRWLVFIAYMMGLSIGVHLLNLLTIPALVFIWYFRRYKKVSRLGLFVAAVVALALLGFVQNFLIPGVVQLCAKTELWFVNDLGLPFNSGTVTYFAVLTLLLVGGIVFSHLRQLRVLNTSLVALTTLLIGYSSFFVLIIRAQAGPPINENNTSNAINLLSYLNREQYGDWPLLYGPYYNTPLDKDKPWLDGEPLFVRSETAGCYIVSDSNKADIPNYDDRGCTIFPRMWSSSHGSPYQTLSKGKGHPVDFSADGDGSEVVAIPTFGENLRYFFGHQVGWMYGRYFLWNFAGRQNDRAGGGNDAEGNVLYGGFIDWRLGNAAKAPAAQLQNKARNNYYSVPLLLGILGLIWQFKRSSRDATVVLLLFLFTGLAITLYLNMTPWQPRERDYAFVGSFYAFSIWIGLGAIALVDWLNKLLRKPTATAALGIALGTLAPVLLVHQNFDDHNRSGRTAAQDFAVNLLNSCDPNAILFTYADNDTFTLWYAQEVLGIRRDVRIVCLSLLRSDWYINQMKHRQYTSAPLPVSMNSWDYREGKRDYISIFAQNTAELSADSLIRFVTSKAPEHTVLSSYGDTSNFFPTRYTFALVDKAKFMRSNPLANLKAEELEDTVRWNLNGNYLLKDQLVILDILAHNNWERPIYFAGGMPGSAYAGLNSYLQCEGLAWRLVPVNHRDTDYDFETDPVCNVAQSQKLFSTVYEWGGLRNSAVYADETVERMFVDPMRAAAARTAICLVRAQRVQEAATLIQKTNQELPATQVAPDEHWLALTKAAFLTNRPDLARSMALTAFAHAESSIRWYATMRQQPGDYYTQVDVLNTLYGLATTHKMPLLAQQFQGRAAKLKLLLRIPEELLPPDSMPDTTGDSMK